MVTGKLRLETLEEPRRQFRAESGSGHSFLLDDHAGNTGPTPTETVLLALGGCTAFDVISILRKKRQTVTGYSVELKGEPREEFPRFFTRVEIHHHLEGEIDPEAVRRAIELSETTYCSVGAMIGQTAKIEHTFEIVKKAPAAQTEAAE